MIFPGTSAERREGKKEAFMAENKKFVITVGRQYGSGGRTVEVGAKRS
mgnify:CR=1 FL=1